MPSSLEVLCRQIRARSAEHKQAMQLLHHGRVISQMIAILRQEVDSMIRVIFLLSIPDITYRQQLIDAAVNGDKWKVKGKNARITDREMVDLAQSLQGWTQSVYKFECAFIHLSNCHDHESRDPLSTLNSSEKADILRHMRHYHGGPSNNNPSFEELSYYFPMVFDKIAGNLECYLNDLEKSAVTNTSKI